MDRHTDEWTDAGGYNNTPSAKYIGGVKLLY